MQEFYNRSILTVLTFLPMVAALLILLMPRGAVIAIRGFALAAALVNLALSVPLFFLFRSAEAGMQFELQVPWVYLSGQPAITYHVGIDGISLFMVLLTTFLSAIAIAGSFGGIRTREREYYALMLFLEAGMAGVFVALDLVLFYTFWEAMLIPMYFIIGVWGGQRRIYAAVKFFLYTMIGSLLMLVAILVLVWLNYQHTGVRTFDILQLSAVPMTRAAQNLLFLAFGLAFAIKVPMFPFHTWLPDAHVEAPTAGSVILAGVLLKMGTYGFLRFGLYLFPEATVYFAPLLLTLGTIGILYAAIVATMQKDLKRLVAYSSVAHLGFIVLGTFPLTPQGLPGGELQLVLIARALVQQPEILLLDEPGSHLDLGNLSQLIKILRAQNESGVTVLFSTHDPTFAARLADDLVLMQAGRLIDHGPNSKMLTEEKLSGLYNTPVTTITQDGLKFVTLA